MTKITQEKLDELKKLAEGPDHMKAISGPPMTHIGYNRMREAIPVLINELETMQKRNKEMRLELSAERHQAQKIRNDNESMRRALFPQEHYLASK